MECLENPRGPQKGSFAAKLSFIIILLFDAKIVIDIFVLVEIIVILLSINIINRICSIICLNKAVGLTFKNIIKILH